MWEIEEEWFFPELSREQAKAILQGTEMGVFLVRVSGTANRKGPVLSASHYPNGSSIVIHFTINEKPDGKFSIGKLEFPSIQSILIYYHSNPLTDDGLLKLTRPAEVKFFAKENWVGSAEIAQKLTNLPEGCNYPLLGISCGQILRLIKRNTLEATPLILSDGTDAKLWLMENEEGVQGLVSSSALLIYGKSDYESFMERQAETTNSLNQPPDVPPKLATLTHHSMALTPTVHSVYRSDTMSSLASPFSERRMGLPSHNDTLSISITNAGSGKPLEADLYDLPSFFPAKAVALLDRNPNFYDQNQLRFRKGDILTVLKPKTNPTMRVEDPYINGWCEAMIEGSNKKGLIPIYNAYIKWL